MTNEDRRPPIERDLIIIDGKEIPIVRVPVAVENRHGEFEMVHLYAEDHARLEAKGVTSSWFLNGAGNGNFYVRFKSNTRDNNSMVSRVILGLWKEDEDITVRYRDGRQTNLLRHNLQLVIATKQDNADA